MDDFTKELSSEGTLRNEQAFQSVALPRACSNLRTSEPASFLDPLESSVFRRREKGPRKHPPSVVPRFSMIIFPKETSEETCLNIIFQLLYETTVRLASKKIILCSKFSLPSYL